MRIRSSSLIVALAVCLSSIGVYADGLLDGLIGEQYGATIALDSDSDGICGFNTVDEAGARGDLIELNALSWSGSDFGNQWYFSFTVDSSQPLDDQGEQSFFGSPCVQKVNYLLGIDAGCDGAAYLEMAAEGPWSRGFDWEVDYFVAVYATGPDTMAGQLWRNDGDEVSRSVIDDVLVVTTTIGFRRQIEIVLPDDDGVPEELRDNSPIAVMVLSVEDFEGEDAGVYDWIGGAEDGECSDYPEFTAAEMICTAPNSKQVGRPTDEGANVLQSLSLARKDTVLEITSELTCDDLGEETLFIDGEIDAGRYTHLVESLYAAPYAGGSSENSDFIGESSASTYYNSGGSGLSTYSTGGDADIRQVRIATDPNYLSIIVEGPTALGWLNEADRANVYIAIDVPVKQSNTDIGEACDDEANAPAGRMVNFKGWDPDYVIELIWQGVAVLWESDGVGGWIQVSNSDNEAVSLIEEELGFYYAGVFESYEFAVPWTMLGYMTSQYDPQNIKLSVYTTADENTDGLSDWDIFDQAPGVGQGCSGLGCHERIGDDPGDSDCENDADPLLSDFTMYVGSTADGTAAPASNVEVGSNPPGENGNDIDTIEEYYTVNVIELPLVCGGTGGDCEVDEEPPTVICPPLYVDPCELPPVATTVLEFDLQGGLAIDNCDEEGLSIQHLGDTDLGGDGCADEPAVIVRAYRIYDTSGNSADCEQLINIVDSSAPNVTFPPDAEMDCGDDTSPDETGYPIVDDNCDNAEVTFTDEVEPGCPVVISRTWFVSDDCGYEVAGVQTISVFDLEPPEITVEEEVTVEAGGDISPEAIGGAEAFDFCDGVVDVDYEDEFMPADCEGQFLIERFWFAEDSCGNEGEAETIITVLDTTPPVLILPDNITIQCSDSSSPLFTGFAEAIDLGDEGVEPSFEDSIEAGACDNAYTISRTWMAEDDCGNFESGVQVITVVDTIAPGLVLPADTEISCGDSTDPAETGTASAEDNCDIPNISYTDEVVGECPTVIIRTWTAADACGNSETANQTITIVDSEAPSIDVVEEVQVEFGSDTSPESIGGATAADNCSEEVDLSYEDDVVPGECEGQYTIERFWMAADNCGNEGEAEQVITVVDTTAPVLTVPENVTIQCSDDSSPASTGEATAEDVADEAPEVTYVDSVEAGACDNASIITRTWTAVDDCGNSVSANQVIEIVDTIAPGLVLPEDVEINCGDSTDPAETGTASAEDNCDIPNITFSDEVVGECPTVIIRTWTATDACGNNESADQTITIVDNEGPVLTAPASVEVEFGSDTSVEALGEATATDNCGDVEVGYEDDVVPGECVGQYTIERFWSAADSCGNASEADQVISVVDTTAPELTVPADVTIECSDDSSPASTGQATATDLADEEPVVTFEDSVAAGACDNEQIITRLWTAEDACGNFVTVAQAITVVDTTAPELTVPADTQVSCSEGSDPSVTGTAAATDNCDIPNVTFSDSVAGSCPTIITRSWTAIDACGNNVSADQIITVVDDVAPVLTVPADVTIDGNGNTDPAATGEATAVDACGSATVSYSDVSEGGCPGSITRTWTAVDECGNNVSADQVITLTDTTAPEITCPADATVGCGVIPDPSETGSATAIDDCDGVILIDYSDVVEAGQILRTWTAMDVAGNVASCLQTITTSGTGGCVQNMNYWKRHYQEWPVNRLEIGGLPLGKPMLWWILNINPRSNEPWKMMQQLIVAKLNIANGACASDDVNACIENADELLLEHGLGDISKKVKKKMKKARQCLQKFNTGEAGTPACD